jgi:hypothetical protein
MRFPLHSSSRLVFVALALAALSGCSHVRPWERGKLAHPSMGGDPAGGPAVAHVYSVQEGAVGGEAAVGGGCGCN